MKNALLLGITLAAASLFLARPADADVIIEYSESGADLLFEYSGSLQLNADSRVVLNRYAIIGNQNGGSIFYSNANYSPALGSAGTTALASLSAPIRFWTINSTSTSGSQVTGDTLMFRWNTIGTRNDVNVWLNPGYTAGSSIVGSMRIVGRSIVGTGLTAFTLDMGDVGTITMRSKTAGVPEPGTLALLGLGLAGIGLARRRRSGV